MKSKFKSGSRDVLKERRKLLGRNLNALAKQGARTAELHSQKGLILNVYGTEPGEHYRRTRKLLRDVYATGQANSTGLGIQVGNRAEYASLIEYGSGPYELSPQQLESYLEAVPAGGLLRFGRSGKAYLQPGPFNAPALHTARLLTIQRMHQLMQDLWS
ncbi:hypothetical protein [Deinococcus hohokamensis]|uniref:HK97 gp10 family phage protein n=1 Tax=Deinococcus hohokamensis TaxID=309883 RepID=A0ABV9I697_9DEIO